MSQKRKRGLRVKAKAPELIDTKMREKGFSGREQFALEIGLTTKTLDKFFLLEKGSPQRKTVEAVASFLKLDPAKLVEGWYPPTNTSEVEESISEAAENFKLNYQEICKKILGKKIEKLTTTPLTNNDGKTLNLDDVYVRLGLVEPKQKPGKGGDISAEMGGKFYRYADYEVTRKFDNDRFFDEVIAKGETPKSKGRKIAIVGEPGAGKTTLLQKIAFENPDESVAIWISLAELKGKTVEEYLLQVWLKSALKVARVTPDLEDALVELFNQGKVWLLLDGVDEMGVNNSLGAIASQISGWVASARVILTCRLNVWDAGKNDLYSFDVYRNLDFNEGQIEQFISKWFDKDLESRKSLLTELEKPGKKRIKDLIKNPLRLTMLCWFWQRGEKSLPKTKAQLYQQFVDVFYKWKNWQSDPFPTKLDARKALEKAFGELAKKAIDKSSSRLRCSFSLQSNNLKEQEKAFKEFAKKAIDKSSSPFRLTHRQICDVLGEEDEPLFKLAKRLGWLNLVGVAEENKYERVYAFFHPTFQEYFAAKTIDSWQFFLKHNNENPNPSQGTYRVFEKEWKEVVLLWLGRDDINKQQKEDFMYALFIDFEDCCGPWHFYWEKGTSLAYDAFDEFSQCSLNKVITIDEYGAYLLYHKLLPKHKSQSPSLFSLSNKEDFKIFCCARYMTYPEFYYAWHNNSIQTLEKQFVDILSQLQPTDKTYPIAIEASSLKDYTDEEKIANELSYKIYRKVFSKKKNIPQTRDASQLKRLILRITTHLNTENIALILHNCEPNPSLIKFCHRLTDTVNIAWLTDAPLESPLRGFPPNQINLKSALETWLNELE